MNTKLTLSLDIEVIEQAKRYAKKNGQSVSGMVGNYFKMLSSKDKKRKIEITPFVKSIPLKGKSKLSKNFDYKKEMKKKVG